MNLSAKFTLLSFVVICALPTTQASSDFLEWITNTSGENTWRISLDVAQGETEERALARDGISAFSVSMNNSMPQFLNNKKGDPSRTYYSLEFDGYSSYMEFPEVTKLVAPNELSFGIWVKPDTSSFQTSKETQFVASKGASLESGFSIAVTQHGGVRIILVTDQGHFAAYGDNVLEPYLWQHIGFSWNGDTLQLYVDGKPVGSAVPAPGAFRDYALKPLTFGKPASMNSNYYKGLLACAILTTQAFSKK